MDFNTLDIVCFVSFLAAVIGISLYASRKEETSEDYFLAGRGLSWWVIGLSLIASNISTEHFVGMAGQGFDGNIGMAIASYEWIAALSLILVALFLLPRFLRSGIYTIPQYLEYRYNKWARTYMGFGLLFMYAGVTMATVLYAGAIALHSIFGIGMTAGVWIIGLIAGLYTVYGGLKAVVWSDVIQGTALMIGGAVITVLAFDKIGGIDEFIKLSEGRLHTVLPASHPELPWPAVFIGGMWLPNLFYWGLNQFITQRTLAAKNLKEGQKGVLFAATLKLFIPMIVVFPGIIAFELYGNQITDGDQAYPYLVKEILPVGFAGIMFAALFGATMSTLDSLLNSAATIFTVDFYQPFINKNAKGKELIKVGRISTVVFVILACLCTTFVSAYEQGLYKFIQIWWGCIQPGIVAAFFLGFATKRISSTAAIIGMLINTPLYLYLLNAYPDIAFLHHMAICFVVICAVMIGISYFKPNEKEIVYPVNEDIDITPAPSVKIWSLCIFLAVVALYIIFR